MKGFFFCLLTVAFSTLAAQSKVIKYYDANWMETSKDKAAFYADFVKDGANYNCTSYWMKNQHARGKSTYADTVMQLPIGLQVLYFENGNTEDSSFYEGKKVKYSYHYYPNKQLQARYFLNANNKEITEGYDESGNKIKNYIMMREAGFKGGQKAWVTYINKNATKDLSVKGITGEEQPTSVTIEFVIDENGDVIAPKVFKSSGYKIVDNDALQVIANSPSWKNAILYNQPVKALRIQPITYILKPQKK